MVKGKSEYGGKKVKEMIWAEANSVVFIDHDGKYWRWMSKYNTCFPVGVTVGKSGSKIYKWREKRLDS